MKRIALMSIALLMIFVASAQVKTGAKGKAPKAKVENVSAVNDSNALEVVNDSVATRFTLYAADTTGGGNFVTWTDGYTISQYIVNKKSKQAVGRGIGDLKVSKKGDLIKEEDIIYEDKRRR